MGKFTEKLLWLYIILLPLRRVPTLPVLAQKLQYADLVFIILFIAWAINCIKEKLRLKWSCFDYSVLFLLGAYIPSLYNAKSHLSGVIELSGLIYLACLYFVVKNIIDSKEKIIYLIKIWVGVSVIVSLIGMIAFIIYFMGGQMNTFLQYTQVESSYHILPRIESVFRNTNMYASYMLVSIVFAFILFYHNLENKRARPLIICALVIMFSGALLSASRLQIGIYLSSFLILLKFAKNRIFLVLRHLAFFVFLFLLIAGLLTTIWTIAPVSFKNNIEKGTLALEINSKYSWHIFSHSVAINMIKKHPFIGVGLGNYGNNFREYADWEKAESSYYFILSGHQERVRDRELVFDPLSTYLGSFAETGLVGFTALLILLASLGVSLFRSYKNKSDSFKQQLSWFILSGFFGFLINGFIVEILTMRHFWIMLAMGITAARLKDK